VPQKTRPDDSFLNFPVNTGMAPKHGELLSYSTGTQQWTNVSGANLPLLDGRYLKLDASNDPLRGALSIVPTGTEDGLSIQVKNSATPFDITQQGYAGATLTAPVLLVNRYPADNSNPVFNRAMIEFQQLRGSGTITGEFLDFISDNVSRVNINPSAQGTGTLARFDGDFQLSSNGLLLLLKNNGSSKFYVNASGTAYSNDVPLIKEAPTGLIAYGRQNASWNPVIPKNGWVPVTESWIRTGNHTLLISGNVTGTYQKGTKLLYTDSGVGDKYGVVGSYTFTSGTTTTLNLIPNTDYIASGTITNPNISYVENPSGFPDWFNYSATWSSASNPQPAIGNGTYLGKWKATAKQIDFQIYMLAGSTTTFGTGQWYFLIPVDAVNSNTGYEIGPVYALDAGTVNYFGFWYLSSGANLISCLRDNTAAPFNPSAPQTWAVNDILSIKGAYQY